MKLDHVGIAVPDTDEQAAILTDLTDVPVVHEEVIGGLKVAFLEFGESTVELVQPLEGGTVQRFLDREGPGLHHLAFRTDDIEAALETAGQQGYERIDDAPRPGARGHRVAFLHPRSTGGVLIEYVAV